MLHRPDLYWQSGTYIYVPYEVWQYRGIIDLCSKTSRVFRRVGSKRVSANMPVPRSKLAPICVWTLHALIRPPVRWLVTGVQGTKTRRSDHNVLILTPSALAYRSTTKSTGTRAMRTQLASMNTDGFPLRPPSATQDNHMTCVQKQFSAKRITTRVWQWMWNLTKLSLFHQPPTPIQVQVKSWNLLQQTKQCSRQMLGEHSSCHSQSIPSLKVDVTSLEGTCRMDLSAGVQLMEFKFVGLSIVLFSEKTVHVRAVNQTLTNARVITFPHPLADSIHSTDREGNKTANCTAWHKTSILSLAIGSTCWICADVSGLINLEEVSTRFVEMFRTVRLILIIIWGCFTVRCSHVGLLFQI